MREIDKRHIEETRNRKINEMVSDELADEDLSAGGYEEAFREMCKEYGRNDDITEGGNVSFDKLLGGTELEIEEVYAYKEGAYVTGNYRDGGCWEDR